VTSNDNAPARDGALLRIALAVASIFLAAGALLYAATIARLIWPEALTDLPLFSYGRLVPIATGLLLGWLLLAGLAAAWHVLPRIGGRALDGRLMSAAFAFVEIGVLVSVVSIALGSGEGGRYLEGPWYSEAVLALGLLLAAVAVTRSANDADDLSLPGWYFVGALWWGFAATTVAAVPGLEGIPAALQMRFAATVLTGLVPIAVGLGALYYLIGRLVPDAAFHPRLGAIGFWSLGFAWLWLSPGTLQNGPTPGWFETMPVLFAMGLAVAMLAILADLAYATRGKWDALRGSRPLQMALLGVLPFVLLVGQLLFHALRGPSGVVDLTDWEMALDVLTFLGAATLWLGALAVHALSGERGWSKPLGAVHLYTFATGLVVTLVGFWISGLQQGYAWVGGVNAETISVGDAFRNSVVPLEAMRATALVGLGLMAIGLLGYLAAVAVSFLGASRTDDVVEMPGAGSRAMSIVQGALLLFTIAGLSVFALPAIEVGSEPSELAAATREHPDASPQARGREIYAAEGCWQCHTQQVRAIVTDVGLGTVSQPGDYVYDPDDLLGARRIGPDLAHVASRGWDFESLMDHLADPRATRSWSVMPSYSHLDTADLEALAAYLASLE
jgi:cytochrome c oxidase cbb3-type subunit I/II